MLLNLLNSQMEKNQEKLNGKHNIRAWIIDIGASHHMTRSLKLLCDVKSVIACPVGLPNGKEVMAEKKGNIVLDGRLKLTNVLYVPSLNCNMISVSQLVEESNCIIQFTNNRKSVV